MADYQVVDADQLDADMTSLAETIRAKGGTSAKLTWPEGYKQAVEDISTGVELPALTNPGTAADLRQGKQLIDADGKTVEGALAEVEVAAPTISVAANGRITAAVEQAAGITAGGRQTASINQNTIGAQTITPGPTDQSIPAYNYLTGKQTIKGDANLTPDYLYEDQALFGVQGAKPLPEATQAAEPESKDVDFYDYDGTRLYSYTLAEAQALTELPPLPSRDGLVCQGWNWTLDEIKSWGKIADVGATYTTDDGSTRIYIHLYSLIDMPMTLHYNQTTANGVSVDWGDGSDPETVGATGAVSLTHEYTETGDFMISMTVAAGTMSFDGARAFGTAYAHQSSIRRVEIGDNCSSINKDAFAYACNMATISLSESVQTGGTDNLRQSGLQALVIPRSMTNYAHSYNGLYGCGALRVVSAPPTAGGSGSSNNSWARNCTALRRAVVPRPATSVNNYEYNNCFGLERVEINPRDVFDSIGTGAFGSCYSLLELEIPATTVTINAQAFYRCYSLRRLRFLPTTPPTVPNANAFTDIPTDCIIEVPTGSLAAYTAATNYPSADTYTYVEVDV